MGLIPVNMKIFQEPLEILNHWKNNIPVKSTIPHKRCTAQPPRRPSLVLHRLARQEPPLRLLGAGLADLQPGDPWEIGGKSMANLREI